MLLDNVRKPPKIYINNAMHTQNTQNDVLVTGLVNR